MREEMAAERERRVEHIGQMALRRIVQAGLARGWQQWYDEYYEAKRQKQLLAQAAGRLAKPQLSAAYSH